jgi:hypothetical protein
MTPLSRSLRQILSPDFLCKEQCDVKEDEETRREVSV